ncbi:MAG TPA: N-6 DNA methylase [Micromonosporaceae bacterium]
MQERATVTAADIARLAGVGRAAVSNWRRRHADFPAPVGGTAASPEFDLAQVEAWLCAQGKLPKLSKQDRLWLHLTAAGDSPAATLATVGAYLLAHQRGDRPAMAEDEPKLGELLQTVGELADEQGPQPVFDALLRRLHDSAAAVPRSTPDDLADLMVALADASGGSVLDPACGTGSLLRAAARAGCTLAHGQELDEHAARLAALWLSLHGVAGEVRTGDSLRSDAFTGATVDAVVCHPPFGVTNWGQEELVGDPRWIHGSLPPRTEPELAWVLHALAHVRVGGYAVVLMPPAAAGRRAGRRIRAELLRRGALRAVIALPPKAVTPHAVPLHLWVLRRPAPDDSPPMNVLLVDSAAIDGDTDEIYPSVVMMIRSFLAEPDSQIDEPGFARSVPTIELLDEEVDLTPARRHRESGVDSTGERLVRTRDKLASLVTEMPALMPDVDTGTQRDPTAQTVSIAELARIGAVEVFGPVRPAASPVTDSGVDRPVLTVEDVMNGNEASGQLDGPLSPWIVVERGDVVVPAVSRQLAARVVENDGAVLGRGLYLLRPNPALLDSWFLAGHLRTTANERQASGTSGSLRFDIKRAQVPRLTLDEQRRHSEVFQRLEAFDNALRHAAALGSDLIRLTADGLASGILRPRGDSTGVAGGNSRTGRPR